jgi:hypothetical protein
MKVGLLRGQVEGVDAGAEGFGNADREGLLWVDLDDYHQICNFSTHRAGDWMLVDRERVDAPAKVRARVSFGFGCVECSHVGCGCPWWALQVGEFRDPVGIPASVAMRDLVDRFSGRYDLVSGQDPARAAPTRVAHGLEDGGRQLLQSAICATLSVEKAGDASEAAVAAAMAKCNGDAMLCLGMLLSGPGPGVDVGTSVGVHASVPDSALGAARTPAILEAWVSGRAVTSKHGGAGPQPVAQGASTLHILSRNAIVLPSLRSVTQSSNDGVEQESNVVHLGDQGTSVVSVSFWMKVGVLPSPAGTRGVVCEPFNVGSRIWGNFRTTGSWYAGRIARVNNDGTFNIVYDDGDTETNVMEEYISDRKVCVCVRLCVAVAVLCCRAARRGVPESS